MAEHGWLIEHHERAQWNWRRPPYGAHAVARVEQLMAEADAGALPDVRWCCTAPDIEFPDEPCNMGLRWRDLFCPDGHRVVWD